MTWTLSNDFLQMKKDILQVKTKMIKIRADKLANDPKVDRTVGKKRSGPWILALRFTSVAYGKYELFLFALRQNNFDNLVFFFP